MPSRHVRASFTDSSITVCQAYPAGIAERAVKAGRLVSPFQRDRMTWIKPSFLWMMYDSARADLPAEHSYPLPDAIAARIGASQEVHGTASYPAPFKP